jgi:hypothetical protein
MAQKESDSDRTQSSPLNLIPPEFAAFGTKGLEGLVQKVTELRRLLAEVEANDRDLRRRQDELEADLVVAPAAIWHDAAEKASYLLGLSAVMVPAHDSRQHWSGCQKNLEKMSQRPARDQSPGARAASTLRFDRGPEN